ncbi:hypothetical protein [Pseudoalteromonas sp. MMG024]|uniref:hypothetical protein n=1 Tax=Pseudoalteromonas sp. MMG024 TaxID=2909980 RepID=UPI001F3A24DE|nr:hypothetical protein [Pseudoalteromonas sp. MMG024]MCF6459419.1 hypothetical protein [Pseudoalteromonas sp. MMG024]
MIVLIPVGTLLLNAWRKRITGTNRWTQIAYLLVSITMAGAPLIYVRSIEPNHTAIGVVLAGVALFWFAIVGARSANT